MVIPIDPIPASNPNLSREASEQILKHELQLLTTELTDLKKLRDYYDGEQSLVFGTEKFKAQFGPAFPDFRSNWCAPVVEAVADKLYAEGISLGTTQQEIEENKDLARQLWNMARVNDIDEQQAELYEGALVEGRSYAIVWPSIENDERIVRIDWNPADLIRVRYADDDPRKVVWAMKRWLTPSGKINITVYTENAIYKYVEQAREYRLDTRVGIESQRPDNTPSLSFEPRLVQGENWPLTNPYSQVPVVPFPNKRGSELHDVIPLQDGINYLMLQAFSGAGFLGFPQRGFLSGVKEPKGGWSNSPGRVWQVPPDIGPEGDLNYGTTFEFAAADLSPISEFVAMTLQHIAHQTKTPTRLFYESDRGGRGDAPSGESLLVEDQPLLDKVEDRQRRFGNAWYRVFRLVSLMGEGLPDSLPLGELVWHDPRSKYRSALMEEGAKMVDKMGLPIRFVAKQLGFTADEQQDLLALLEEQKEEQKKDEMDKMEMEADIASRQAAAAPNQPPPSQNG